MDNFTNIRSLIGALAQAMNLISPEVEHHHEQTAYLAWFIGQQMGLDEESLHLALFSALLHDVGSIVLNRQASVEEIEQEAEKYAQIGAKMLWDLPDYREIAAVIAYCQSGYLRMQECLQLYPEKERYLRIASAVHVADTASLCIQDGPVLNQVAEICKAIEAGKGTEFSPEAVEALLRLKPLEVVWLDVKHNPSFLLFFTGDIHQISLSRTVNLTRLISRIIDYRSAFTAMHSAGVSASAKCLSRLSGMSEDDCLKMEIAGNLHDVGKLVVPQKILEKPGKLTEEEFNIVKEHAYYTRLILKDVDGFEEIADWAGFHHEKLNGMGYPFHMNPSQLDLGSRILAVADVFSAITEDRPYRKGMTRQQAESVLREDVERKALDGDIVALLIAHYQEVDDARAEMSHLQGQRYYESLGERSHA